MTKEPGAVRSVSTYAALLQAIADLRSYGHPLTQAQDVGPGYPVLAGRKIFVTAPIVCSGRLSLTAKDTGLEIEFLPFCSIRNLDLVVSGGTIVLRNPTTFGFVPPDAFGTISVGDSGLLVIESAGVFGAAITVDNTSSLAVRGGLAIGGTLNSAGDISMVGAYALEFDLTITDGTARILGGVTGDVAISGGAVDGHGRFEDVSTTGGSGSFKYADCDSFTDGGGTWTSPVV